MKRATDSFSPPIAGLFYEHLYNLDSVDAEQNPELIEVADVIADAVEQEEPKLNPIQAPQKIVRETKPEWKRNMEHDRMVLAQVLIEMQQINAGFIARSN